MEIALLLLKHFVPVICGTYNWWCMHDVDDDIQEGGRFLVPRFPLSTWSFVWRRCLRGRFGRFNHARTIDRRMTRHDAPRAHRLEADGFSSEFLTLTITNWRISLQFGRFLVCFSQKWKKNDFFEGKVRQIWNRESGSGSVWSVNFSAIGLHCGRYNLT